MQVDTLLKDLFKKRTHKSFFFAFNFFAARCCKTVQKLAERSNYIGERLNAHIL